MLPGPSKTQRGDTAQFLVLAKLSEAGLVVMTPSCQALPFDLGFIYQDKIYKVQIKRALRGKYGRYSIPFCQVRPTRNGQTIKVRYSSASVDFLIGVVVETGDCYFLPLQSFEYIKSEVSVDPKGLGSEPLPQESFKNQIHFTDGSVVQLLTFGGEGGI